jgi:pilus assembly protein Flp/PilA
MPLTNFLKRLARCNRGGTAIEYGLIASLVVIACIGALQGVANENTGLWATVSSKVSAVMD